MPMHETEEQKAEERRFAKRFAEQFGGEMCAIPYTYGLDYLWQRDDGPERWMEIKKINYDSTELPEFMCSLHKLQCANTLYQSTHFKSFLIVWCKDEVIAAPITNLILGEDYRIKYWGREDRHAEPQAMIPYTSFETVTELFGD